MKVRYADEIQADLLSAMAWYDERRHNLGDDLEDEFYVAVSAICVRPESYAPDASGLRACRIRRFTAVVYYAIEFDTIVVIGLLVNGRDIAALEGRG